MRQKNDRQEYLLRADHRVVPDRLVVRCPRTVQRWAHDGEQQRHDPWRRDGTEREYHPAPRRTRQHRPPGNEKDKQRDLVHTAPQIVENLPAGKHRQRITVATIRSRNPGREPPHQLPVATDPAVFSPRIAEVVSGIVVVEGNVGGEPGARITAFDQIVREQHVRWKSAVRRALEGVDVVNPLAGETAFAVKILVHIRDCSRIRIDAGVTRVNGGEPRAMRARQRHANSRLQNSVAARHAAGARIDLCMIERMRNRTYQKSRAAWRKDGIRVERDDVANFPQRGRLADYRLERSRLTADESVEISELSAFPFPTHPHAFLLIPQARSMEQEECVVGCGCVIEVEGTYSRDGGRYDRI